MTKPREVGIAAATVLGGVIDRVNDNQKALFDAVVLLSGGDKQAAIEALKRVSDNNNMLMQMLMYIRTGQISKAEDLLIDAKIERK